MLPARIIKPDRRLVVIGFGAGPMSFTAALRALLAAAPDDGTMIPVPASWLRQLLDREGDLDSSGDEIRADLTVAQVAVIFDRHANTIRDWIAQGVLAGYRLNGREWRVPRSSVEDFQRRQRLGDNSATPALGKARPRKLGDWRRQRDGS
jgi:excisionase family DNA binding protein